VRGGERLAVAYTLVDNCIILGIDPRRYLQDTIDKLERGHALSRMSELTPASWAAKPDSSAPNRLVHGCSLLSASPGSARLRWVIGIHANLPHAWSRRNHPSCKGVTPSLLQTRVS
jgi:hypothetical protein